MEILELLVRFGLVSGAAVAAALGKFALAAVLLLVALGLFLRMWRLRKRKLSSK